MIAKKITMKVIVEVLSMDAVPGLLQEVAKHIYNENTSGHLNKSDGDSMDWGFIEEQVTL